MTVTGVILAGGLARRMGGRDKAFLSLGGGTLLDRALARLGPQVDALAINSNGDPAAFADHDAPLVPDLDDSRAGPLAGVLAGLTHAEGAGASHVVTVAVDTPFFPSDLVERLRADLARALADGERKVDRWTARHGCAVARWDADPFDPFFNVNTPDDLARAGRMTA